MDKEDDLIPSYSRFSRPDPMSFEHRRPDGKKIQKDFDLAYKQMDAEHKEDEENDTGYDFYSILLTRGHVMLIRSLALKESLLEKGEKRAELLRMADDLNEELEDMDYREKLFKEAEERRKNNEGDF